MDLFRTDLAAYLPWNIASCVQGIIKFIPICISHCIQHSEMVCADKYSLLSPLLRFAETITAVIKSDNANSFFISLYGVDGPLWSVSCSMLFHLFWRCSGHLVLHISASKHNVELLEQLSVVKEVFTLR